MSTLRVGVIGGGPGGYVAAIRAAQLGAQVTLIEKSKLGGTCLNEGCIPTKALLHTAQIYDEAQHAGRCGVHMQPKLDFTQAQAHKNAIVQQLVGGIGGLLKANKVQVVTGTASLLGKTAVAVNTANGLENMRFDKLILATGSVPVRPPIPGVEAKHCVDSTGALSFESVPSSLVIIGGGVIGIEFATLYSTLGSKVTVIEMMDTLLPMMDGELTAMLRASLEARGVEICTSAKVVSIVENGQQAAVHVELPGNQKKNFSGHKVLVCVGRRTNTEALALDAAGVKHDRGRIQVNNRMETSVPGVYAIGDCLGGIMLAHIASAQGEIAAENAMGHPAEFNDKTNPSCVYTKPEFAGVGLTEEQANSKKIPYDVGKFPLAANGKALIMSGGQGMIKILAGKKYKEILGVHMLGERATDLIAEAALAIGLEATVDDFIATIHAHPTVGEAMREAALAVEKRAIHIPNR